MTLAEKRRAIRHLLNENEPSDAMDAYYAFYHPDAKTQLFLYPAGASQAMGYVCLARTGIDLFRALVTMRLPEDSAGQVDFAPGARLLYQAMPAGTSVFVSAPIQYRPLLGALFEAQMEELLRVCILDRGRFEPILNVLVTQANSANGLPRFVIRESGAEGRGDVVASAGLNWQSPRFAEISVSTQSSHRRQGHGRSVVAALAQHVLASGRIPIYVVAEQNEASIRLAESLGFVDIGIRQVIIEGTLKEPMGIV
ncbi:MAG: GNAT family N-acetyltransferase [Chloroflexi bacterium]|nr:GNAT family N-acetyltransferase [Chloroflexota bacterium]MCI0574798.1 GNAT family N-acetyltransferase [Chloroflexota bacterium]MCI0649819.1 GNAT family N-acetyltransferase [Chloroflexota bacterium]MCI0731062.1 GNAT family N-acetyltransferase [Chloroflexota bacterium]